MKANKILYLVLSLLPIVGFVVYMAAFICMFTDIMHLAGDPEQMHEEFFSGNFFFVFGAGILMAIITFAALVVFIIHVINNRSLSETEKIMWVLIFVFAGMIGFPIYWFMRGMKDTQTSASPVTS